MGKGNEGLGERLREARARTEAGLKAIADGTVLDGFAIARRKKEPIDPEAIGKRAANELRPALRVATGGSAIQQWNNLFPDPKRYSDIGASLRTTPVAELKPLPNWGKQQAEALQELVELDRQRAEGDKVMKWVNVAGAVAAVVAAVVAIVALFVATN